MGFLRLGNPQVTLVFQYQNGPILHLDEAPPHWLTLHVKTAMSPIFMAGFQDGVPVGPTRITDCHQDGATLPRSINHRRFNYPHTLSYKAGLMFGSQMERSFFSSCPFLVRLFYLKMGCAEIRTGLSS